MAIEKTSGKTTKIVKSKIPLAEKDQQARFGVSGPVNSSELNRIKRAQQKKKDVEAAGGTYYSAYDSSLGTTEQQGYNDGKADLASTPGGGGGGRNPLNDYTQQLQTLLTGGSYADPYNDLMSKFQGLFDTQKTTLQGINTQAGTTINDSMNSLETMLKAQTNPYANLQAENVTPTAQLSSFLQGQNVGDQQTQDYAQVLNAQNAGSATNFNNLAGVLRSMATAGQTGALADVATQRDASTRQLATTRAAAGANLQAASMNDQRDIEKLKTTQQSKLIQQLLAAIAKGGMPKKGKLF